MLYWIFGLTTPLPDGRKRTHMRDATIGARADFLFASRPRSARRGVRRAWLMPGLLLSIIISLLGIPAWYAAATPAASGAASSTVIPCLPVGPEFLGSDAANPYMMEQEVWLYWTGPVTSARLVGYEFSSSVQGTYGRSIYVNGTKVGGSAGKASDQTRCGGFNDPQQSWIIPDPAILNYGRNVVTVMLDPAVSDKGWGLSRVQIEVNGATLTGPRYRQVTIPSTYFNNWANYGNEGTWAHIMEPRGYNPATPAPLLITAHGFGSNGLEVMLDYDDAADARGWLVASADLHGEVWEANYELDPITHEPRFGTVGRRTMGSRASQWDILDTVNYMQANYNVDPARIYLVGHSMGGLTALLTGARWADRFAAVVSDSGPTDLIKWEDETNPDPLDLGSTPNASINYAIRTETGTYSEPTHYPGQKRVPTDYPFEYQRRSPVEFAANFKHLPLLMLHPASDHKVHRHHPEDLYLLAQQYAPEHVERVYFPGVHGDRIADFANYTLDWLGQFTRPPADAPRELSFATDWSGAHFWLDVKLSADVLREAHWVRVHRATYNPFGRVVEADIENRRPLTGDYLNGLGVYPPQNLAVTLTFDVARMGLPASGPYTVELVNKDDGTFTRLPIANAAGGKVAASVPAGAYIVRITAGDRPPATQVLTLRQGTSGYTGAQDTYLSSWLPDANNAGSQGLYLYHNKEGSPILSPALKFDLSPLPAGAYLRYAVLSVRVSQTPDAGKPWFTQPMSAHALNRPWQVSEATWNRAAAGVSWAVPGAEGVPQDRAAAATDAAAIYADGSITTRYGFDLTGLVRGWLANPGSNQGVLLRSDPVDGLSYTQAAGSTLGSSEAPDSSKRPFLTLIYTLEQPTATPSPTSSPTATYTATPTSSPTPTHTLTPTATATPIAGQIAGAIFMDGNRNGRQDTGEEGLAGRLVQLWQGGVLQDNATTNAAGQYSFPEVAPGDWQVLASVPANYVVTTGANPATVRVTVANTVRADFGIALPPTVTPTATVTLTPTATVTGTRTATSTPRHRTYLPLITADN